MSCTASEKPSHESELNTPTQFPLCQLTAELVEYIPDGIIALCPKGLIQHANPAMSRICGISKQQLLGRSASEIIQFSFPTHQFKDILKNSDSLQYLEAMIDRGDGTKISAKLHLIYRANTRQIHDFWLVREFSSEKTFKTDSLHAEKLESLGRLSSGVAHDFNNLLTVITGYGQLLLDDDTCWSNARDFIREITNASVRAGELTRKLLNFGRRQPFEPKILTPDKILRSLDGILRRLIRNDIDISFGLCCDAEEAFADPHHFENSILNLVANARDAMPDGGLIKIESNIVHIDEIDALSDPKITPGSYIMISVSDTGSGIADDIQPNIFEPFFTTKELGHGTGLGLASVYGFVKNSGGHISIISKVGNGTTVKMFLPQINAQSPQSETPSQRQRMLQGRETILLVEDDHTVREVLAMSLTSHGYTVIPAASVSEGVLAADQSTSPISLIVSDLIMPNGGGMELMRRIRVKLPNVPVVYLSGYTNENSMHLGISDKFTHFLTKPLLPDFFARAIRNTLDRHGLATHP